MRCAAAAQQALRYVALAATGSGFGSAARAPARAAHSPLHLAAACALDRQLPDARRHASAAACFPSSAGRRGARRRAALQLVSAGGSRGGERGGKAQPPPSSPAPPSPSGTVINFNRKRSRLAIVLYPDPCLRAPNADVTLFDAALKLLAGEMFDIMYKCVVHMRARRFAQAAEPLRARRTDGVGLAAPQVGVNKRLMVYNAEGVRGRGKEVVLCNPVLVEASQEEDYFEEGCLSFPGIYADVKARALPPYARRSSRPRTVQQQIYANPSVAAPHLRRTHTHLAEG
jgi:peptide deformylase